MTIIDVLNLCLSIVDETTMSIVNHKADGKDYVPDLNLSQIMPRLNDINDGIDEVLSTIPADDRYRLYKTIALFVDAVKFCREGRTIKSLIKFLEIRNTIQTMCDRLSENEFEFSEHSQIEDEPNEAVGYSTQSKTDGSPMEVDEGHINQLIRALKFKCMVLYSETSQLIDNCYYVAASNALSRVKQHVNSICRDITENSLFEVTPPKNYYKFDTIISLLDDEHPQAHEMFSGFTIDFANWVNDVDNNLMNLKMRTSLLAPSLINIWNNAANAVCELPLTAINRNVILQISETSRKLEAAAEEAKNSTDDQGMELYKIINCAAIVLDKLGKACVECNSFTPDLAMAMIESQRNSIVNYMTVID